MAANTWTVGEGADFERIALFAKKTIQLSFSRTSTGLRNYGIFFWRICQNRKNYRGLRTNAYLPPVYFSHLYLNPPHSTILHACWAHGIIQGFILYCKFVWQWSSLVGKVGNTFKGWFGNCRRPYLCVTVMVKRWTLGCVISQRRAHLLGHPCTSSILHGCQMAIARFLDRMCLALQASGL